MNGWQMGLIVGGATIAVLALAITLWVLYRGSVKGGMNRVTNRLRQFASIRSYKVLTDVTLPYGKQNVHVDNILVGFFGLLFINTKAENADFYGEERDEQWVMVKKEVKSRFPNPLNQGINTMDAVRKIFASNNVYNISMEQLVVFTASFRKTTLNIKETLPILNVRKLGSHLNRTRFEKDNGVDVDLLVKLIEENRVKGV